MTGYEHSRCDRAASPGRRGLAWLAFALLTGGAWGAGGLALLVLPGCDDAPGEWSMIIYPDRTDRTRFLVTPRFKTLQYCRESAIDRMKELKVEGIGDYECGFRCQLDGDPHKMNVCVETHK